MLDRRLDDRARPGRRILHRGVERGDHRGGIDPPPVDGRGDRKARDASDDRGIDRVHGHPVGESCQCSGRPIVVVAEPEIDGLGAHLEADPGDRLVEPGPAATERHGLGHHGVDVGDPPDIGEGDRRRPERGPDPDGPRGEVGQVRGERGACLVGRHPGEVHAGCRDARQDPSRLAVVEDGEAADDRRDADDGGQDEGEREQEDPPAWSRQAATALLGQGLIGDGHRLYPSR